MSDIIWPVEYIRAMSDAVNIALSEPIETSLEAIKLVLQEFRSHPSFLGRNEALQTSSLRNSVIAATLSTDQSVQEVLEHLIDEIKDSKFFDAEEQDFLIKAATGKIKNLGS